MGALNFEDISNFGAVTGAFGVDLSAKLIFFSAAGPVGGGRVVGAGIGSSSFPSSMAVSST